MPIVQSCGVQLFFHSLHWFCPLFCCAFISCQAVPKDHNKAGGVEQAAGLTPIQLPIGIVHMVDPGGSFVLIQSSRFLPVEPGASIVSVSINGIETAQLVGSSARKGQFITADIISGRPGVGDRAVMTDVAKVDKPASDPLSQRRHSDVQVLE